MSGQDVEYELEPTVIELNKDTTQPGPTDSSGLDTPDSCITPPLPMEGLCQLTQRSGVRRACIEAVALNTVGLGFTIVNDDTADPASDANADQDSLDKENAAIGKQLDQLARRDARSGNPTFLELMQMVKQDEEECGWGMLEVSRDKRTGQIDGLYHAPAKKVRRKKDRSGYVLLGSSGLSRGTPYYAFGDKVHYDDGQPTTRLVAGRKWSINELLVFKLYTSESRDYGLPRDVGLITDYAGDRLAAESNVSFFDSSGTPPTVLFVAGVESKDGGRVTFKVPQETAKRIADTIKSDAGHRHRVAIVPVPPGTKAEAVKLGELSDRDMGFTEFRGDNAQRVLGAWRLQPIFVPVVSVDSRYDAEVQRAITLEQVFDPEQRRYEDRLTMTVLNDLGVTGRRIAFKRLAVESDQARREASERAAEVGAVTNGEFRDAHGLPRLKEDGTHVPEGWNNQLIDTGKPKGAENRVNEADDQRGLRPGIGGRVSRDKREGHPRHVEQRVDKLRADVAGVQRGIAARARTAR